LVTTDNAGRSHDPWFSRPYFLALILGTSGLIACVSAIAPRPARAFEPAEPAAPAATSISFLNDIEPVLTRFGCNSGGCHGKLAGQNGFRLSLRGFAPDWDHQWLARESRGRRLNLASPELSLLLRKAVGELPHGGGQRFERGSDAYRLLSAWIAAGAPGPKATEAQLERLETEVATTTLKIGQSASVRVFAVYSDGQRRDVTWLVRFDSQDAGALDVNADGVARALRPGETILRAAFQGQVAIVAFTVPQAGETRAEWYASRWNAVDSPVFEKLSALRIEPSPLCDDATFLRRATLDLIGRLPTPEESRAFLGPQAVNSAVNASAGSAVSATDSAASRQRRQQLVDHLLDRPEWADYWALQLGDLLQNRKERDHDVRGVKGVRSFHAWLRSQLVQRRSWRDITRSVLTARGPTDRYPEVGYFVVTVGEQEAVQSEVVDSVAQAFLGTRIGCARCHNHPLERYSQDDYYHFAAFFSRVALRRQAPESGPTTLIVGTRHTANLERQLEEETAKLGKANAGDKESLEKRIADLRKQLDTALAAPATAGQPRTGAQLAPRPLDRSTVALVAGGDPRAALVEWIVDPRHELFAGAMVNRLWKHFLGIGLVEPVDDLRATNPPSNAALWTTLCQEFTTHEFDLRHMMRLIVNSRVYQLSSEPRPSNTLDARFYSHFYPRRLDAEVLLDAICQATGVPDAFAGYPLGTRAIQVPDSNADSYFLSLFGRSARVTACACERDNAVTLPQLLHLQNGDTLFAKINAADGRLKRLLNVPAAPSVSPTGTSSSPPASSSPATSAQATLSPTLAQVIDELYLATLCRLPDDRERSAVLASVRDSDRPQEAFADLFWALLNSKEFAFQH
jgi:hypothetical protein